MEIWRDVKDYEGLYMVSDLGRVKSVERYVKGRYSNTQKVKEKIKKQSVKDNGYLIVSLYKNNKVSQKYVHRLVAEAFIDNPMNKPTVNHIDCNIKNNNVCNLEWNTYKEQEKHKASLGRRKDTNNKKVCVYYNNGVSTIHKSVTQCSKDIGIHRDTVYTIINNVKSKKQEELDIKCIKYLKAD